MCIMSVFLDLTVTTQKIRFLIITDLVNVVN